MRKTIYARFVGDPDAEHPNLGPFDDPPFYAVEVHSGVIGTKGGSSETLANAFAVNPGGGSLFIVTTMH